MDEKPSILVVDDEPGLLRMMTMFLERSGYQVTAAGDAVTALDHFNKASGSFKVVVADLTLPDMAGDEMSMKMLEADTGVAVLICSGYPFDLESVPADKRHRVAALQKPFLPDALRAAVADLLRR